MLTLNFLETQVLERAMDRSPDRKIRKEGLILRLFIAGDEPNSKVAIKNLAKISESHINGPCEVEVVDVFESFETALENQIFLTPALMKVSPAPPVIIFGDLSDTEEVIRALRPAGGD